MVLKATLINFILNAKTAVKLPKSAALVSVITIRCALRYNTYVSCFGVHISYGKYSLYMSLISY